MNETFLIKIYQIYKPVFNVFMATGVVLFHNPSHTSPNWPWPNFLTNFKELRSISHWSLVLWESPPVAGFSTYKKQKIN